MIPPKRPFPRTSDAVTGCGCVCQHCLAHESSIHETCIYRCTLRRREAVPVPRTNDAVRHPGPCRLSCPICEPRPAKAEQPALQVGDYVRGWRREPNGDLAIGRVRDVGEGPTARVDWWSGPNARTCDWFPKNALVRIEASIDGGTHGDEEKEERAGTEATDDERGRDLRGAGGALGGAAAGDGAGDPRLGGGERSALSHAEPVRSHAESQVNSSDESTTEPQASDQATALEVLPAFCEGPFWDDVRKRLASALFKCRMRERHEWNKKHGGPRSETAVVHPVAPLAARTALETWAAAFAEANPSRKYLKARDVALYRVLLDLGVTKTVPKALGPTEES